VSESVAAVLSDLRAFLNDSVAAYATALSGVRIQAGELAAFPTPPPENPDPTYHLFTDDPNLPGSKRLADWRMSEAKIQMAKGGPVETILGQQWIVFVFSGWEEEYRRRLADALGCLPNDLRFPLIGDLRRLRNDVVHHHGIATARNAARCEVLHWFTEGDQIRLDTDHIVEFNERFPWTELGQLAERNS
jgi:hypothetical protein